MAGILARARQRWAAASERGAERMARAQRSFDDTITRSRRDTGAESQAVAELSALIAQREAESDDITMVIDSEEGLQQRERAVTPPAPARYDEDDADEIELSLDTFATESPPPPEPTPVPEPVPVAEDVLDQALPRSLRERAARRRDEDY